MPKATRASEVRVLTLGNLSLGSRARGLPARPEPLGQRHVLGRRAPVVASRLEYAGQLLEARLGNEHRAPLLAELALAHDRVPVAFGSEPDGRIVDVQGAEPLAPNRAVELVDDLGEALTGSDVVPRGEHVARVQAHAEALSATGCLDQLGELLERAPEGAAGARRVFQEQPATLGFGQRLLDHLAGSFERLGNVARLRRTGMQDHA